MLDHRDQEEILVYKAPKAILETQGNTGSQGPVVASQEKKTHEAPGTQKFY